MLGGETMSTPDCPKCGAPQRAGFVICPFCKNAYSPEVLKHAIPCKACNELSAWGQMRCVRCNQWLIVQCVFCNNVSPHNVSACLSCGEAFAGSVERKAQRDAELRRRREQADAQQRMQAVGTYGGVAASFVGSFAGALLSEAAGDALSEAGSSWFEGDGSEASFDAGDAGDDTSGSDGGSDW